MQQGRNRKLKTLVAGLATAALMAPVAQGRLAVDTTHQALVDKAPQVQLDARHQALLEHHHAGQLVYVSTPPAKSSGVVKSSDGMDWGDAGIGAGALAGVLVVAVGGALLGRKKLASAS
ncbi:MAG TPA: hypothetical protein VH281_01575 [Gaiellaceae bacterium]|jgi:hypothetical protein